MSGLYINFKISISIFAHTHKSAGIFIGFDIEIESFTILSVFKDFIYLFLDRGKGREGNINVLLLLARPLVGGLAHNPGMYPDWESNL